MIDINTVVKEVSKNTGIDKDLVDVICKHPFTCVLNIMKDDADIRDIMFNKLFKFKLKRRFKEDKTQKYTSR